MQLRRVQALELTSSLEAALGRERVLQKQVDTLESQLTRCRSERNAADTRCQQSLVVCIPPSRLLYSSLDSASNLMLQIQMLTFLGADISTRHALHRWGNKSLGQQAGHLPCAWPTLVLERF